MIELRPAPLSKAGFASFGEVIEIDGAARSSINQGFAERFNDLARVDVAAEGGSVNVSIVFANPRPMPIAVKLMERHPLGSQIFYPLQDRPWAVLVCADPQDASSFRAFAASGRQGINYTRNTWHHPLLVFDADSRFLVVDRKGPGNNLEEVELGAGKELILAL
ncbi:MAG TPA: ureidoglycolate lyase [Aestuariivirga sp.]|nr:ureidoglycolate lyase [Aestuariivirga sp.]